MNMVRVVPLVLAAMLPAVAATPASAQQTDSLEREVRRLRARMDSLEALVQRLAPQGRDTAAPADELAALRAAARAAAQRSDTARAPAGPAPAFVDRGRNLNQLNPEISVSSDVRFNATREAPLANNVELREFEFSFQSALDPFSSTKIFASFEEGDLDIEEAYAYWTALPGRLRLDIGRFRQQMGELNRWHSHALPESEYPLALREFAGDEGLVGNGLGLYWILPAGGGAFGTHELWGQVTLADNQPLFDAGNRPAVLGHLNNYWQLGPSAFVQVGGTAMYGANPDADLKTRLLGLDLRFTWRPPARALYRSFTLRGEGYQLRRDAAGAVQTRYGAYAGALYQLGRRWFAGARYDYVELTPDAHQWIVTPHLTWWQSEWVYLRAEWQRQAVPVLPGLVDHSDRFVIQAVWAIGPHKHETY
jgi:hypothetical protein